MTVIRLSSFFKFVQSENTSSKLLELQFRSCLSVLSVAKVLSFFVFRLVFILPNKIIDSRFHGNDNHFFHGNDNHQVIIFLRIRTIEKIPQASCLSYNSVRVYRCYRWLIFLFLQGRTIERSGSNRNISMYLICFFFSYLCLSVLLVAKFSFFFFSFREFLCLLNLILI